MRKGIKAFCDAGCKLQFNAYIHETRMAGDIARVGFICPHCGHYYLAFYTNDKIRKLQAEERALLAKSAPGTRSRQSLGGIMSAAHKKKAMIKAEMARLKDECEGGAHAPEA